jgi:hypothetical protein
MPAWASQAAWVATAAVTGGAIPPAPDRAMAPRLTAHYPPLQTCGRTVHSCRNEYFIRAHIHARIGILTHGSLDLAGDRRDVTIRLAYDGFRVADRADAVD